jgi:integrase
MSVSSVDTALTRLISMWTDVDLASGVWKKPPASTKQKTAHEVPLSSAAIQLLKGLRQRVPEGVEWLFPASNGSHRRDVKDAWASACRAANVKSARLHDLRHTYASVLASAGLSLPVIGALLGHTTPTTTARYAHLFDNPLRAATERASAIITGAEAAEIVRFRNAAGLAGNATESGVSSKIVSEYGAVHSVQT